MYVCCSGGVRLLRASNDGTAGRAILTALLHAGVGDVAAVVVRWYGGTKLGTGGLARVDAGGVVGALATLPTVERVTRVRIRVTAGYDAVASVRQLAAACGARVVSEEYAAEACYELDVPAGAVRAFGDAIRDATRGRGVIEAAEPGSGG